MNVQHRIKKQSASTDGTRKKSQKHSFAILSDSEESDIIEILCRSAPQNDTAWTFYRFVIPDLIGNL